MAGLHYQKLCQYKMADSLSVNLAEQTAIEGAYVTPIFFIDGRSEIVGSFGQASNDVAEAFAIVFFVDAEENKLVVAKRVGQFVIFGQCLEI